MESLLRALRSLAIRSLRDPRRFVLPPMIVCKLSRAESTSLQLVCARLTGPSLLPKDTSLNAVGLKSANQKN